MDRIIVTTFVILIAETLTEAINVTVSMEADLLVLAKVCTYFILLSFVDDCARCLFTAPPNPQPPTDLRVIELGSRSVTVSWRDPAPQMNNRVTGYKLTLHKLTSGIQDVSASVPSSSWFYTFFEVEEFSNYEIAIQSMSEYDFESSKVNISFRTLGRLPAAAPMNITLSDVTSTSAHLGWSSPQYTNVTITHYTTTCAGHDVWVSTSHVTQTENVIASLQPFTNYICCVSVSNEAGIGEGACVNVTTLPSEHSIVLYPFLSC